MAKSGKRSRAKRKNQVKAPVEEWNSAAKIVKLLEALSHFFRIFFWLVLSPLRKLGQNLFWLSRKEEPSLSRETPDIALAAPCGVTVAAKCFSKEQSDGPAEKMLSHGTVSDEDPRHDPNSSGHSNEVLPVGLADIEEVISSTRRMDGGIVRVDRVGYDKKGEAKVNLFKRVHEIEVDETKSKQSGNGSEDWKQKHDDLKRKDEVSDKTLMLRQVYSDFEKTDEFKKMNDVLEKEALKLLKRVPGENGEFEKVVRKTQFTKILRTMHFQKVNMALRERFCSKKWRQEHRFPTFKNHGEYNWWEQNYIPEILEKRLEILREAAKKWNSEQDICLVIELVTDLNRKLHPQTNGMERVEMFRLATEICSLRSGGDSKI